MLPLPQRVRSLRLEWLESRTLLAGLGFEDALAQVSPAVKGSGDFTLGFNARIGSSELFVTGSSAGTMTIDFDLLPSFVTAVTVQDFENVTFTGTDVLNKLVATNIKTLDADNITVKVGLYANNVQTVSLASGGGFAVLNGSSSKLEIANLDNTLIISDLQSLAIDSKSANVSIVSLNSTQTVSMLYSAEQVSVAGLTDSGAQVKFLPAGGDSTGNPNGSGNVVTVTPNEQTNILIARIREILRTGGQGNPLAVLDSMTQVELSPPLAAAVVSTRLEPHSGRVAFDTAVPPQQSPDLTFGAERIPTLGELELRGATVAAGRPDVADVVLPADWTQAGPASGATAFPATVGEILNLGAENPDEARLVTPEAQALFLESLQAETRSLRDVVLDGLAAEIVPGERSAFLLVDPKPVRSAYERNRESSLQEIA